MSVSFSSPWPDPNSPVLSKIDFGVPLVELFKWLDVRDTFLGENYKQQDITAALALARDCKHPDAVWLTSIFDGKDVSTKEEVRKVFLSCENDARALCFAWWMRDEDPWRDDPREQLPLLRRAAEMGHAFACSVLIGFVEDNKAESFRLAQLAASLHERDGYSWLGFFLREGLGCKQDLEMAEENFLIAAELNDVCAAQNYGVLLNHDDPACWVWLSRAALRGLHFSFRNSFAKPVNQFFSCTGSENAPVVFLIGQALKGNIDMEKKLIFGQCYVFDSLISPANQAVLFYESQIKSARLAVDTWTWVSARLHLIKDMRILIGKMIWDARFEANYNKDFP